MSKKKYSQTITVSGLPGHWFGVGGSNYMNKDNTISQRIHEFNNNQYGFKEAADKELLEVFTKEEIMQYKLTVTLTNEGLAAAECINSFFR